MDPQDGRQEALQAHRHRVRSPSPPHRSSALLSLTADSRSLKSLKAQVKRNPYARKTGAPMQLFNEAAVESLALRVHGGVRAHQALCVAALSLSFLVLCFTTRL